MEGKIKMKILLFITFILSLAACGGGSSSGDDGSNTPTNNSPSANAGVDKTVEENSEVSLIGMGTDSDGTIVSYSWYQTAGTVVTISNANTANASFTTPEISVDETLIFQLIVTDNDGATNNDTVEVVVNKTTSTVTTQHVNSESNVVLSAQKMNVEPINLQSDNLTFLWTQIAGPTIIIENPTAIITSFTAPNIDTSLTFTLEVTDSETNSSSDDITILVAVDTSVSCPEGSNTNNSVLTDGWDRLDLLNGTWQFDVDFDFGWDVNEYKYTFCSDGTAIHNAPGTSINHIDTWYIDEHGVFFIIGNTNENEAGVSSNLIENVLSSTSAKFCTSIFLDQNDSPYCIKNSNDESIYAFSFEQVSARTQGANIIDPNFLNGYWKGVESGRIISCDKTQGECININESSNRLGINNLPSTVGLATIRSISQDGNNLNGETKWIKYDIDTLNFEEFIWPTASVTLNDENSFTTISDSSADSILSSVSIYGSTSAHFIRLDNGGKYNVEKIWNSENKNEPIGFYVNADGSFQLKHTGSGNIFLVDITNNIVVIELASGASDESVYLEKGRYIMLPDLSITFENFVTQTTIVSTDQSNPVGSIIKSNFLSGELQSCEFGYIAQCSIGAFCAIGTICDIPTLEGIWQRSDGRTIECITDLGPCNYTDYGTDLSEIQNLPNIIGQPMLRNIKSTGENSYSSEYRRYNYNLSNKEFEHFEWQNKNIKFNSSNSFTTAESTYNRVE
ncbi:MAG: hypothetical protein COB45_12465 [Gammaproteobacteria bacterium]|nr:MAG: hypothetical protein COB45_12465 [Gammaproteobacteria bacterium]PHR84482.1 MAG: hypothetical protein COA59_05875 [Colwellia sp.]